MWCDVVVIVFGGNSTDLLALVRVPYIVAYRGSTSTYIASSLMRIILFGRRSLDSRSVRRDLLFRARVLNVTKMIRCTGLVPVSQTSAA